MTRLLPIVTLLLLAACGKENSGATPQANDAAVAPAAATDVPSLEGEWKVSMIGGRNVSGISAVLGDGKASISAGCFRRAWTYTQNRNVVAFTASPSGSSNCSGPPSGDEEAANSAISDANMAIFANDGKEVSLSGTGGMLTLQRR